MTGFTHRNNFEIKDLHCPFCRADIIISEFKATSNYSEITGQVLGHETFLTAKCIECKEEFKIYVEKLLKFTHTKEE